MIELGKSSKSDFDLSTLLKWFVIIIFIWCPFYFAYHHYVVGDMFITSPGIVVEKKITAIVVVIMCMSLLLKAKMEKPKPKL